MKQLLINDDSVNKNLVMQISDFKDHIRSYHNSLNNEGVWMFLAALGCWGVTDKEMQNASFILTIIIFFYRLYLQLDDTRSFKQIASDIEGDINLSNLENDVKKARLYDLKKLKSKELSTFKIFKSTLVFLACFSFTVISMIVTKNM